MVCKIAMFSCVAKNEEYKVIYIVLEEHSER